MALLTAHTLAQLPDAPALLDFIARQRYAPENEALLHSPTFALLPDYAQDVIWILDFETEYEMQGLPTLLENSLGQQLPAIARSFEHTQNQAIARCLQQLVAIQATARGPLPAAQSPAAPSAPTRGSQAHALLAQLARLDDELRPLVLAKDYWENVQASVQRRLPQRGPR
jgi:hypothetical protein